MADLLPRDDPELVYVPRRQLVADGVDLYERTRAAGVLSQGNGVAVAVERNVDRE